MQEKTPEKSLLDAVGIGERAKVLLLGVFHFGYPNRDVFNPEERVDMLSERRQLEADEVARRLAAFQPTKVAVEARSERVAKVNEEYASFRAGSLKVEADEGHQIAFPVAAMSGLDRIYGIDEWGRPYESEEYLIEYAKRRLGVAAAGLSDMELRYGLHDDFWLRYGQCMIEHSAKALAGQTLREHLLYLNSDEYLAVSHGMYLSWKDSESGDYTMPDHITGWWYGRNLRIFANLKRITESPQDRILVIFGAGHIPILKHAISYSPKHELVDLRTHLA